MPMATFAHATCSMLSLRVEDAGEVGSMGGGPEY